MKDLTKQKQFPMLPMNISGEINLAIDPIITLMSTILNYELLNNAGKISILQIKHICRSADSYWKKKPVFHLYRHKK